jgi:hypothetical protein
VSPTDGLDAARLAKVLRAIHGEMVPFPMPRPVDEVAAMYAKWYLEVTRESE